MNEKWTGERLETYVFNETTLEHLHRYAIAADLMSGKIVLDIACGEGYGANLLARQAKHVTAIDIDGETIEKAKAKYNAANIEFKTGSVLNIPANDHCFDVVTCFETLEHLTDHNKLLYELKRVVKPSGLVLISTPEKSTYADKAGYQNPYHLKELYGEEFKQLIGQFFNNVIFFSQSSFFASAIISEQKKIIGEFYSGDFNELKKTAPSPTKYWLAVASNEKLPDIGSSLFQNGAIFSSALDEQILSVKKTITYRVGNFILFPFKLVRSIFRK